MTILYLRIAFVSVLFLTSYHPATACEYRAENKVSASLQRSADVISALREATIAGILPTNAADPKNGDTDDHKSTIGRMQRFGNALASSGAEAASGLSMLLVEEGLWSRYRAMQDGVAFQIQTSGAQADDTVVITGEAVLAAMEEGTLSSDEAIARGLIVIVPGDSIDDGKVLSAFASFAKADNFTQPIAFKKQRVLRWRE
ncbi:hypothetical protein [Pseudorhodoplanes sinuspersici]|uniref:Uncharacterized protein n=1 Tax=Pseudorhodoplanes sinuspersici TaxID=1235591 RepID=A0A1W6ZWG8_9HYPH|nr:hypothetical protein [Pseudorhodoplanes sinuspersici]ARQ01653.1 hypothetical protein CAK95_23005 [Pseudorhodoplanes sinuspersici]RKE73373.1 hypothetical protein DFP91_1259 [Pseudorhodoplanes sinuspersici]